MSYGNTYSLKKEIKRPKSPLEWSTANDYVTSMLSNYPIKLLDLNSNISFMSTTIYICCAQYHGFNNKYNDADLKTKHRDFSIKELKKALKQLRIANNNVQEIKLVSRQIRCRLNKNIKTMALATGIFRKRIATKA